MARQFFSKPIYPHRKTDLVGARLPVFQIQDEDILRSRQL